MGSAAKTGMLVGVLICIALVFASDFFFQIPEIGLVGWLVYFAMQGSSNIVLYRYVKNNKKLIWGIIELAFSVAFAAALTVKCMV